VADGTYRAVGRVQTPAAFNEFAQVGFKNEKLLASFANLAELVRKERVNMGARTVARVADLDDAENLGQRQPSSLSGPNKPQQAKNRVVIHAVAIRCTPRRREQTSPFVETHRSGRDTRSVGQLSNQHGSTIALDLLPQINV